MSKTDIRNTEKLYWQAFHSVCKMKSTEGALGIWKAYILDKFSNSKKREEHLDFLLTKGLPQMSAVESDPLVDMSRHITITYKVADGNMLAQESDDRISRSSEIQGPECRPTLGQDDTGSK